MKANQDGRSLNEFYWWAHSRAHGWVVLDKTRACNRSSFNTEAFRFIRCRDWAEYEQGHQPWSYTEAGRFLDKLTPAAAAKAGQELKALQAEYAERVWES